MSVVFRTPDQVELDALRNEVSSLLEHCTEMQRARFAKFYPNGVDSMNRDKLRNAIGLCQRTVSHNLTGELFGMTPPAAMPLRRA